MHISIPAHGGLPTLDGRLRLPLTVNTTFPAGIATQGMPPPSLRNAEEEASRHMLAIKWSLTYGRHQFAYCLCRNEPGVQIGVVLHDFHAQKFSVVFQTGQHVGEPLF